MKKGFKGETNTYHVNWKPQYFISYVPNLIKIEEYPRGTGGYAFEFGAISAASKICGRARNLVKTTIFEAFLIFS